MQLCTINITDIVWGGNPRRRFILANNIFNLKFVKKQVLRQKSHVIVSVMYHLIRSGTKKYPKKRPKFILKILYHF